VRAAPYLAGAFDCRPGNHMRREVTLVESDRDVVQPEGEPPDHHVRAVIDVQSRRYFWWCLHAGYLADLLPWSLSLLERLCIETGKAEPAVLPLVRSRDGYPDVAPRPDDG
jgi:hypothetical protein